MLKKNIEDYKKNIIKELAISNPILTAGDKNTGFNSLLVGWGGIGVLWGKKVAFVFVRKSRYTYQFLKKSESVTLSFLNDTFEKEKKVMGTVSGRDKDKMKETGLHYTYDPDYDGAYIEEADYCFKMKKLYSVDLPISSLPENLIDRYYPSEDIHTMVVCEIKQFLVKESLTDEIY